MRKGIIAINAVVLLLLLGWGLYLLAHSKQKSTYVTGRAAQLAPLEANCSWIGIDKQHQANLGLNLEPERAWTDRDQAYLAFKLPAANHPRWLDMDIHAVKAKRVIVSVDGVASRYKIEGGGKFRLALPAADGQADQTVLVRFDSQGARPASKEDGRWLGIAVGAIRVCSR